MPTIIPSNLTKTQEEIYICKNLQTNAQLCKLTCFVGFCLFTCPFCLPVNLSHFLPVYCRLLLSFSFVSFSSVLINPGPLAHFLTSSLPFSATANWIHHATSTDRRSGHSGESRAKVCLFVCPSCSSLHWPHITPTPTTNNFSITDQQPFTAEQTQAVYF